MSTCSRLFLLLVLASPLEAQRIKVAIAIDDSAARRVFQGAFVAAFRSLGDVDVITQAEGPDYILTGVVLCDPSACENPTGYAASLRLYSPFSEFSARLLVMSVLRITPQIRRAALVDSLTGAVAQRLRFYEETHQEWVVRWGRNRYEQAIRELCTATRHGVLGSQASSFTMGCGAG